VEVIVNGESRDVPNDATIAMLIEALGLNPRHVAVELNLEVVPRARHAEHQLVAGDRLEVVTLVGGG
jgi:sulfur carrier protein